MKQLQNKIYQHLVEMVVEQAIQDVQTENPSIRTTALDVYNACVFLETIGLDWLGVFDDVTQEHVLRCIQKFTATEEFKQKKADSYAILSRNARRDARWRMKIAETTTTKARLKPRLANVIK